MLTSHQNAALKFSSCARRVREQPVRGPIPGVPDLGRQRDYDQFEAKLQREANRLKRRHLQANKDRNGALGEGSVGKKELCASKRT